MALAKQLSSVVSLRHRLLDDPETQKTALLSAAIGIGAILTIYIVRNRRNPRQGNSKALPTTRFGFPLKKGKVDVGRMEELVRKFGSIFSFNVLGMKFVFLCDEETIRDAFVGQADIFSGRMQSSFTKFTFKDSGLIFIDGPKWQEHRRFVLSVLRSFGFGKNITEQIIQDELKLLQDELARSLGTPTFPRLPVVNSVSNVISLLVFAERCNADSEFEELLNMITSTISSGSMTNPFVMMFYRLILLMPGDYFKLKRQYADVYAMEEIMRKKFAEHFATIDWNNERDLVDAYLVEKRKLDSSSVASHTFNDYQLFRAILELYMAGMETTSTTIVWALLLMAKYPEVQKRVHAEIDAVIGHKPPQLADRSNLVYTTAVLHEVERYVTLAPVAIPHRVTDDTVLRGYFVPAGTLVVPYLFGAHRDARVWKKPTSFDPSHFYDESTKSLVNTSHLITFGVGKRACLGESLATQELFILFTGLMQRFSYSADPNHSLPDISEDFINASIRLSPEYKIIIEERK